MSLTREQVEKIAHLARLALSEDRIEEYQEQLSSILDYAEMLNELDLTDVQPTAHAIARHNVLRDDVARPGLSLEDVLYNAPNQELDQFKIQSVLE